MSIRINGFINTGGAIYYLKHNSNLFRYICDACELKEKWEEWKDLGMDKKTMHDILGEKYGNV
jgi:hypothetical protein